MPLHVSRTCAHHQEVKIALHSFWYHHTYRWPSRAQVERGLVEPVFSQPVHETATCRCDDTRSCVMKFWPPDDEHMFSKHVEAWNKLIVKLKLSASSWLNTEINKLRFTVNKTSKFLKQRSISPQNSWLLKRNALRKFCYGNILWLLWCSTYLSISDEDAACQCFKHGC